ncbi:LacI family DNA-binding transcriptional regulator [Sinorhizobium sp. 8-89]|uniref:LacI family DNA-binding transcriptional regulator n=1 Tax=Sinorhizobium sp. 7-81 TaxID=3049087 RepID=UPI0024C2FD7D|nr:LacI family DNA-binding transcriptional regulator [Sinorhizobium sp. 7-81]MDK1389064.1 LacI family DNA-binding transcriptional regulator [Sinorhizobium sp. 7-81]
MRKDPSRATGRPTLAEVARIAGVSQITASRALRDVPTVDPGLVSKIREAAKALGYVPNPAARTLASARSQSVIVLVPALSNQLYIETLEAIHNVLRPRGYEVLIGNFHYSREEEEELIRNYLAFQPCGILLTGFDRTEASLHLLEASKVPCVHMMELTQAEDVFCVGFSQEDAGAVVARHLLARGKRRLAYVAAQLDARVLQRGEGFKRALAEAGVLDPALEIMVPEASSVGLGGELFGRLLRQHPDVDGIFFCNDDLAYGAIFEAQRQGIAVPDRIAFVGFNDLPMSAHIVPRLTSIRTPREAVGKHAAHLMLALLAGAEVPDRTVDLEFELVVRESS